jgi:Ca-activated chloride channel family protein
MRLAEPGWLLLLLLVPVPWIVVRSRPRLAWPTLDVFTSGRSFRTAALGSLGPLLRSLAVVGMAVALARPQTVGGQTRIAGEGVAIVVALDNSTSMNTPDFPSASEAISRLEGAKRTFARFVQGRPDDLIGLVVFANYPDLASTATTEHGFLVDTARSIRSARPGDDGTNLGDAIAWALQDLRKARQRRKVLILLTDGRNNPAGNRPLDPEDGARLARDLGVTLHTIAIGRPGSMVREAEPLTRLDLVQEVEGPDFALLERLAQIGRGRAFVAADVRELERVFQTIDELEKSPVQGQVRTRYREEYAPWVGSSLALIVLDRLLAAARLRRLP